MSEYNQKLDEVLWEKEEEISYPFSRSATKYKFLVRVMRYAGGKEKVEIKKLAYGADKKGVYCKLGRLTKYELMLLLPILQEARDKM